MSNVHLIHSNPTVYEEARALVGRGYFVVPLIPRAKAAKDAGWQNLRINAADLESHFPPKSEFGIGLLTGLQVAPDCYVLGVDIDSTDQNLKRNVGMAFTSLPPAKMGKKGCTYFCRVPHFMKKQYVSRKDPTTGKKLNLIEILAAGQQTVLPPSIHPETGEPYKWLGVSLAEIDPLDLPVYDTAAISEINHAVKSPDSPLFGLNTMQWLGAEGGGDIHNSVLAAVAAMVALGWDNDMIWRRVDRATRLAVEGFGDVYDWPGWQTQVLKMVDDARIKGFADKPKKERVQRIVARWFMDEFTGPGRVYHRDGRLALYKNGAFDLKDPADIRHLIATKFVEPEGVSLIAPDWETIKNTVLDLSPRFPAEHPKPRVCLQNGTFDMDTGEINGHRPDDYLISRLAFNYDETATCPIYDQFMMDTFANLPEGDLQKSINTYEEFIAHTLFECTDYHKFMVVKGQPRTGKSTLVNIARMMHSESALAAVPVHEFGNERYRTTMVGKLLNVVSEVQATSHAADDFLKAVTAGDMVQVRYLYAEPMLVKLPTRIFIACNEMFRIRDNSGAVEARMLVLSADNPVPEDKRDINLTRKLREEIPGIFNRMYRAWARLRERGHFEPPTTSAKEIKQFTLENNHAQAWITDRCEEGQIFDDPGYVPNPDASTDVNQLYLDYVEWAKLNGFKTISSITFGMRLSSLKVAGLDLKPQIKKVGGRSIRCRALTLRSTVRY